MNRMASGAIRKLVEEMDMLQQSHSAGEKLLQNMISLGDKGNNQEDIKELNSTIGNIEQVCKRSPQE